MDYLSKLRSVLSGKPQQQPTQSFGNNLMVKLGQSPIGRGLVGAQRFLESPRPIQLPQVPQIVNPTVRVGIPNSRLQIPVKPVGMVRDIINEPVSWTANTLSDASVNTGRTLRGDNISNYQNLKSPVTKLGYQVGNAMLPQNTQGLNVNNNLGEWLGNIGGSLTGPLSVYGGGKAKNLLVNNTIKQGLKKSIVKSGIEGAKIGGGYGIASGLNENRNEGLPKQLFNSAVSGAGGALFGGVLGGAMGGVGELRALTKITPEVQAQLRDAKGRWVAGTKPIKPPKMPQAQWEFQLNFNKQYKRNPYEPVMPSDLTRAVAYETEKRGAGLSIRDINKDKNPLGTKLVDKYQRSPIKADQLPPQQAQPQGMLDNASNVANPAPSGKQVFQRSQSPLQSQQPQLNQPLGNLPQGQNPTNSFDGIIAEASKQISSGGNKIDKRTLSEVGNDLYTSWVDRFHPITKLSKQVEEGVKKQGAELRPDVNPRFTIKRFLGAGGIAENKFNNEFKPILKQIDSLGINKTDLDVYLKNRRDVGFGQVGRDIYGSDPAKAQEVVNALEAKYGDSIKQVADQVYGYQNKMFDELVQAGFIDPKNAKLIRQQNPDYVPFFRDMEDQIDNYLGIPSNKLQQAKNPLGKIKGSNKQVLSPIESVIANTFKYRAAIEKNNVARSIVGLQKAMPELGFKKVNESGASTISVWENGKKSFYEVGNNIAETVKGLNEEQMNSVLKLLSIPSTILRQGATGRNPAFMLPNMVRDQLDAAINSKYGYVPFVDWARGLAHLVKKDDIYQKWQQSGAQISLGDIAGKKDINQLFKEKQGKSKFFNWIGRGLDAAGQISEQPTRIGLFAKAYQKTKNPLVGAMESREGTLDFARMGSKMKVANSLIPFLNVGVQGFDKMVRSAKANPAKFSVLMATYGAAPAIATTLWNVQNHPQEYKEIPQWEKNANFIIVTGRNEKGTVDYISIPKGNVIQYIANPVENFISYASDTNKDSISQMALQFLSSGSPVIGDGSSPKEIALKTVGSNLPQAIKPITENLLNKSFYKYDTKNDASKEIVPYYFNKKAPGDRSYEFTPSEYKTIGKVLNVSPLQVQNIAEGYLAGYVKEPIGIIETLRGIADGKYDRNKTFLLRRFIKETYPTAETKSSSGTGVKREVAQAPETSMIASAEAAGFDIKNPFKKKQVASKKTEKISEVSWESDAGRKTTVKLTGEKLKKATGIDAFNKENPNLINARKIYNAPKDQVSERDKQAIYKQLGFTREQLDYDHKSGSTFNTDERIAYIQSKSPSHDKLIANLKSGREMSIAGNRFATDSVIDQLYKDKLISLAEKKELKALTPEKKSSGPVVGTKAKKLKVSFKAVKPPKLGSTRSRKSVFKAPKVAKPKVEKINFKKKKKSSL